MLTVFLAGLAGLSSLAILLPLGHALDGAVAKLNRYLDAATAGGAGGDEVSVPRWLRGLTDAVTRSIEAMRSREHDTAGELRDLRVSHRIAETERDQLRGVLHAMHDAVVVTDPFDEVIIFNDAAAEVLRFDATTSFRTPIDQVVQDRRLRQLIREIRESGDLGDVRTVELEVERGDESVGYQATFTCRANNKGEVGAVVTILHDLTREREIAQMKSDFVSKASHELRTPLSSIRAYVEMLVDGEATDEESRSEFYRIIQNETNRLSRMIDNMLNISRIEAGIIQIEREPVDFKPLLNRAGDTLEPQAKEKNIGLTVKAAPVDLTAEGDADMLYQVVLNLVSNAIKYTPEGGRITLTADTDNLTRSIVVTVSDTGLGIPPDALPKLFEKFYRIENFKRVAKGTGLGLNLCKHIVETVHHGQIGVESKLGMGSKFWFSIPMRYAGAQAA